MQAPKATQKINTGKRLIGLEFENHLVYTDTGFNIEREDIKRLWNELLKNKEWQPTYDQYTKALVGVTKKIQSGEIVVNTDAGVGLLELAMPPCETLAKAEQEWQNAFTEILEKTKALNMTALSLGILPRPIKQELIDIKTEKGLYLLFGKQFPRHNIMLLPASHQICVDVSVDDMTKTVNALTKLGGFIIALTANSVIEADKIQNWKETRTLVWKMPFASDFKNLHKIFGGIPQEPFGDLSEYFRHIWDASAMIIIQDNELAKPKNTQTTTWDYLTSEHAIDGVTAKGKDIKLKPTESNLNLAMMLGMNDVKPHIVIDQDKADLNDFLNAIKNNSIEQYLKDKTIASYIEIRVCPVSPKNEEVALPALILGLINNIKTAETFCELHSWEEAIELKETLSVKGMDFTFKGKKVSQYLKQIVDISKAGLEKRGYGEEKYLLPLYERIEQEKNPADKTIEIFKKQGITGVISNSSY